MSVELLLLTAAFGVTTLVAEAAGAANTGIAMSFGAMAFMLALIAIIARRP